MASSDPYPKSKQLARGERRYRRKVASPKQWQAIIEAKRGQCRLCGAPYDARRFDFHHVVPRASGGGDVADNIIPLCRPCHNIVTAGRGRSLILTPAERAYGIRYTR